MNTVKPKIIHNPAKKKKNFLTEIDVRRVIIHVRYVEKLFFIGVCIYPTPPPLVGCDSRSIFQAENKRFEFRNFSFSMSLY